MLVSPLGKTKFVRAFCDYGHAIADKSDIINPYSTMPESIGPKAKRSSVRISRYWVTITSSKLASQKSKNADGLTWFFCRFIHV